MERVTDRTCAVCVTTYFGAALFPEQSRTPHEATNKLSTVTLQPRREAVESLPVAIAATATELREANTAKYRILREARKSFVARSPR